MEPLSTLPFPSKVEAGAEPAKNQLNQTKPAKTHYEGTNPTLALNRSLDQECCQWHSVL